MVSVIADLKTGLVWDCQLWQLEQAFLGVTPYARNSTSIWSSGIMSPPSAVHICRTPYLIRGVFDTANIRSFGMVYPRNTVYSLLYVLSDMGCFYPARIRSFGMGCILQAWCMLRRMSYPTWGVSYPTNIRGFGMVYPPGMVHICQTSCLTLGVSYPTNIRSFGIM